VTGRLSRQDLWEPRGEIPLGHPTNLMRTWVMGPGRGAVRARPEIAGVPVGTLVSQLTGPA
jgi:hypothetical protein